MDAQDQKPAEDTQRQEKPATGPTKTAQEAAFEANRQAELAEKNKLAKQLNPNS